MAYMILLLRYLHPSFLSILKEGTLFQEFGDYKEFIMLGMKGAFAFMINFVSTLFK
jgi:hypothetical protein